MNTILIVSLLVVGFLFIQLLPYIKAREIQGRTAPDLSDLLTEKQRGQRRLLLYFWAPRCSMCRSMTPVIDKLAREREDVVSVNVTENVELARRLKVMGTPTLVLLNNGTVDKVLLGAKSEKTIHSLLTLPD
ncbi:MAG: thioredoxin family protein [Gammaproteobacteria bacterium]|jgi:thioredoxin 1|nr:thioredoxin family protein [Gammaproteobacteria bacterium]